MPIEFSIIIAMCARPDQLAWGLNAIGTAVRAAGDRARVIIVDNGLEPSAGVAAATLARDGIRTRYLKSEPRDKTKALNAGIRAADTEWLAFTDDDTLPDAQWLVRASAFADASGFRMFGGRIIPGPVEQPLPRWLRPGRSGRIPEIGVFARYEPAPSSGRLPDNAPVPFGANVFVHKNVFGQYGGYDESLWALCGRRALGVEDSEFGVRLKQRGEPIGYCHEALVVHPVRYDRARLGVHLRLAYSYGWREPMIFLDPRRPRFERYRIRIALARIWGALADLVQGDAAGPADHLVEATRCLAGGFPTQQPATCNPTSAQPSMLRFGIRCRFAPQKGIAYILDALRIFRDRYGDVNVTFAGQGGMATEIRQFIAAQQLLHVRIVPVSSPLEVLAGMDVFVHPGVDDAMPVSLVEALMCGVPCVATRVGGVPDLIRDGVEGFLIEPGMTAPILEAMERFAAMPAAELAAFRHRARARYEECCTPEQVGATVAGIYREMLEAGKTGAPLRG